MTEAETLDWLRVEARRLLGSPEAVADLWTLAERRAAKDGRRPVRVFASLLALIATTGTLPEESSTPA